MHKKGLPNLLYKRITNIRSVKSLAHQIEVVKIEEWQINFLIDNLKLKDEYNKAKRLLSRIKIVKEGRGSIENGCWIISDDWSSYVKFEKELAHRLSYRLFIGPLIEDHCICHKCDRPGCINHKHLFQGTNKDNLDDHNNKYLNYRNGRLVNGKLREVVRWNQIEPLPEKKIKPIKISVESISTRLRRLVGD